MLAAEFLLIAALVSESWIYAVEREETAMMRRWLGEAQTRAIGETAQGAFEAVFVRTGVVESVHRFFVPSRQDWENAGAWRPVERTGIFQFIEGRLNVIWFSIYQTLARFVLLGYWLSGLAVLALPFGLDGWVSRRVKEFRFGHYSGSRHRYSLYGFGLIWYALLLSVMLPVPIHPMAMPVAILLMGVMMNVFIANIQKKI